MSAELDRLRREVENPTGQFLTGVPGFTFGGCLAGECGRCHKTTVVFRGLGTPFVCADCASKQKEAQAPATRRPNKPREERRPEQPVDTPPNVA